MPKHPPDRRVLTILSPLGLVKWLKRLAFERGVSMNRMVVDLLTIFVIAAWDPNDPTLSPTRVGARLPTPPTNPANNHEYLDSLVFRLPEEPHAS
jgi:hypothetical protein